MSIKAFTDYLQLERNYSSLTVKAYTNDINSFQSFLAKEFDDSQLDKVNYSQIRSWIVQLVESKISNRSINRKVSALNSYYKFLLKIGDIEINPLAKHKALKTSKKIQVPFSEAEINIALDDLKYENDYEGLRNKLIIELFYSTGIRRIELVNIKLSDIDFGNKTLKVLGKRNKERYVPLLQSVIETIEVYLPKRKELSVIKDAHSLFLTKKGVKIYETLVYRIINEYFSLASNKVKKSPHILRHSFATCLKVT